MHTYAWSANLQPRSPRHTLQRTVGSHDQAFARARCVYSGGMLFTTRPATICHGERPPPLLALAGSLNSLGPSHLSTRLWTSHYVPAVSMRLHSAQIERGYELRHGELSW